MPTIPANSSNPAHIEAFELGTVQKIAIGAISAASAPISADVSVVRIIARTDCHIVWGTSPTATVNDTFVADGQVELLKVPEDERVLAVIESTPTSGDAAELYITELP